MNVVVWVCEILLGNLKNEETGCIVRSANDPTEAFNKASEDFDILKATNPDLTVEGITLWTL